jgi:hypothetical protein
MKRPVHDHGAILHWMGAHHLFPVRGASADDVGFASHGELEGRTPIGWHAFFPALARTHKTVFVDDETGAATVE